VDTLRFDYDELPVSVNKLYTSRHGRKVLTAEGRRWKNAFITSAGNLPKADLLAFASDPEQEYELILWFYVSAGRLYNVTYGKDKRVKSPFSDMDTSNLIKLVEDCISSLVGVRDRNNFTVCAHKREAKDGNEHLIALFRPLTTIWEEPE
jgi:hypothetical protein